MHLNKLTSLLLRWISHLQESRINQNLEKTYAKEIKPVFVQNISKTTGQKSGNLKAIFKLILSRFVENILSFKGIIAPCFMKRHYRPYYILSLLLFFTQVGNSQEYADFNNITENLASYVSYESPEKTYLQTDKDFYTNGETIWFKTYVLHGITHTLSDKSNVVYVELVDTNETVIVQRKLFIGEEGAHGDIVIPDEIIEGSYLLRVYTKYMLNDENPVIFQKEIPIWRQQSNSNDTPNNVSNEKKEDNTAADKELIPLSTAKPIVQFFPEGGDLITGMENVLGVKITDATANPLALQGKIFNQDGVLASIFRTYEFGLGRASFKIEPNTNYYLQIEINGKKEKYPIPEALLKGYTLRVMNMGDYIKIDVSTNIANGLQGALLVGHLRGDLIFKQLLNAKDEKSFSLKLVTSKMRDGIAHFTLFAPKGEPVCERLTFVESPENSINLSVTTDNLNYGFRKKVDIDLALVDDKGKPLDGDLSMTVVTQNGVQKETENLKSWLLLNSDLGGTIANPNFFFQEDIKERKYLLDLLMLTHGWRRFKWQSILDKGVPKELAFPPEKGIMIHGSTTEFYNRKQPKKAFTTLSILGKEFSQEKDSTNALGTFSFGPFFFQDSITTFINAHAIPETKKRRDQVSIYLDPSFPSITLKNFKKKQIDQKTTMYAEPYLRKAEQQKIADFRYQTGLIKLKEVVVKSPKKTRKELINEKLNSRTLHGEAQNRLILDSIPGGRSALGIFDVIQRVAGVRVFGTYPNQSVQIRGQGTFRGGAPLYVLDGFPVNRDVITAVPVFNILFIDVLKGTDAAIYGIRSANGVIAVYTKRGEDFPELPKRSPGVAGFTIPGFYKTREFYKPNYAMSLTAHRKPDYRTTLHWEPNIAIKEGKSSNLNFYTGDTAGKHVIRVEGITSDGRPVHKLLSFDILEDTH